MDLDDILEQLESLLQLAKDHGAEKDFVEDLVEGIFE
jgi:hypothetical protein